MVILVFAGILSLNYQIIIPILEMTDVTIVRYSFEGEKFEILVKPDPALDYKLGKKKDISAVLISDEIYTDSGKGTKQKNQAASAGGCAMGLDEAALLAQSRIGNSGQVLAAKKKKDKKGVCGIRIKVLSGDGVVRWIKLPSGRGN